jgi:hypothetical protein
MAGLRFTDLQSRPTEFLDLTSVTLEEFQQQPTFEAAFQVVLPAAVSWTRILTGQGRPARGPRVLPTRCP